jgi:hypothetical protein
MHQNLMVLNKGTEEHPDYIVGGTDDLKRELLKLFAMPVVRKQRELFDKFYAWLDGLTQGEYDDMSLTDKCEKFFFKT